jgi:hypothetical protein
MRDVEKKSEQAEKVALGGDAEERKGEWAD